MSNPVVKVINGVSYTLMNQQLIKRDGQLYKSSYWLEGAGYDTNNDGEIANMSLECKIPQGKSDIDLATLDANCLAKKDENNLELSSEPNPESLID